MPANPRLTKSANGLTRCPVCKKVGPEHKHNIWAWILFRWDRNRRFDRPLVVIYGLAWLVLVVCFIALFRDRVWS